MVLVVPRIRDISLHSLSLQHNVKKEDKLTWIVADDLIYCHFDKLLLAYSRVDGMDLTDI